MLNGNFLRLETEKTPENIFFSKLKPDEAWNITINTYSTVKYYILHIHLISHLKILCNEILNCNYDTIM